MSPRSPIDELFARLDRWRHFPAYHQHQGKYGHLLHALAELGFVELPADLDDYLYPEHGKTRHGLGARLAQIERIERDPSIEVLYIQPQRPEPDPGGSCIDFDFVHAIVARHDDRFSQVFAEHLLRWRQPAGSTR